MRKSITRRNLKASEIDAALITLMAEKSISVAWKKQNQRGQEIDASEQITKSLVKLGFGPEARARKTTQQALLDAVQEAIPTALDLGEGWGGTRDGMSRVMRVVGVDRKRQHTGTEGMRTPDILMDFTAGKKKDLIQQVVERAQVNMTDLYHIHASPDCTQETIIQRLEEPQGRGRGTHGGKEREEAAEAAIKAITTSIKRITKTHPEISFTIENPSGSTLKHHPDIKALGGEIRTVKYCCYPDYKWQKQTTIITNLGKFWQPTCEKKQGWLKNCPHCESCKTRTKHEMYLVRRGKEDKRKPAKLPGFTKEASRNRIPPDMAEAWAKAAMKRHTAMREGNQ